MTTSREDYELNMTDIERSSSYTAEQKQTVFFRMMVELLLDIRDTVEKISLPIIYKESEKIKPFHDLNMK